MIPSTIFEGPPTRSTFLEEVIHQLSSRAAPRFNSKAISVVTRTLASTGRAFQLQQAFEPATYLPPTAHLHSRYPVATWLEALSKPLAFCSTFHLNLDRHVLQQAASKDLPARRAGPSSRRAFSCCAVRRPFSPTPADDGRATAGTFPRGLSHSGRGAFSFWSTP